MTTASDVAQWMVDRIKANRHEYQADLVADIEALFGPEWIYENENGNPAINRKVLAEFRTLHGGSIEWEKRERAWTVL
ncbi:DUF6953 family protein [Nocardia beijingensis]